MATTFVLQPDDYTDITFSVVLPEGPETTGTNYEVLLSSLTMNEAERAQFEYAQYESREGGEWRNTRYPLVPITFTVRIVGLGVTYAIRLADMLEKTATLMRAVTNSEGYLKYKPDGLGGTVMDTYYRYVKSAQPAIIGGQYEYWGRQRASRNSSYIDGIPTRQIEISLMTFPFGISNPVAPTAVLGATTVENIDDGTSDYVTVAAAAIKGSIPALTRIKAHPLTSGEAIKTLWIAKRTSWLGTFSPTFNTSTALSPLGVWSTVADAARCAGSYYHCQPAVNGIVYARRYTISNWSDHRGRAAILAVVRNNSDNASDFDIYYRWAVANYPLSGEARNTENVDQWEPILLGEIDLPETEMSESEDLDLYIDICVVRKSGISSFDLDCIKLLYTDEAALQIDMPAGYGADMLDSILLENLFNEVAHVVEHSSDKLQLICNPYGDFITLEPDVTNRLDFAWERNSANNLEDTFGEDGDYWAGVEDFEGDDFGAGMLYSHYCNIVWRVPYSSAYYLIDLTNGGMNTAAEIAAGRMQSNGNDLRVTVDSREIYRWLDGINTAATKVWAWLAFQVPPTLTIAGDIGAAGDVASITFNEATNQLGITLSTRAVKIGNEVFTYASKDDITRTIYGVKRAVRGTSAEAHTTGDSAYWIQHNIRIHYGDLTVSDPLLTGIVGLLPASAFIPTLDLANSTNTSWRFNEFEDPTATVKMWEREHIHFLHYVSTHCSGVGNGVIGLATYKNNYVSVWRFMTQPCEITDFNVMSGEQRYDTAVSASSLFGLTSFPWDMPGGGIMEYTVPTPPVANAWSSWARSQAVKVGGMGPCISISFFAVGVPLIGACTNAFCEISTLVLTLNASKTPVVTLSSQVVKDVATYAVEAEQCEEIEALVVSPATLTMAAPDPMVFPSTAFLCFYFHLSVATVNPSTQAVRIRLKVDDSNYYQKTVTKAGLADGSENDYYEYHLLSSFATTGSPSLDNIAVVEFYCTSSEGTGTYYFDDVRLSMADPDNAAIFNDTYDVWDNESGTWHVYEQQSVEQAYGQIDNDGLKVSLVHATYENDMKISAKVMVKRDAGRAGLVFRCSDATPASEDMYAFVLDTATDLAYLLGYAAGAATIISSAGYTFDVDAWYYLGVFVSGSEIQCFISTNEDTLWEEGNRVINVTNATHASGKPGLCTDDAIGRFTDVTIEEVIDRHLPASQLQVTIYAWFRTIYPFYEAAT